MAPDHSLALLRYLVVPALVAGLSACGTAPESSGGGSLATGGGDAQGIDDLVLVDCLLPGQIRQLGTRMTFLAPRRRALCQVLERAVSGETSLVQDRVHQTEDGLL